MGPVLISVKKEHHPSYGVLYRTVARTKLSTVHELIQSEESNEPSVAGLAKVNRPVKMHYALLTSNRRKLRLWVVFL